MFKTFKKLTALFIACWALSASAEDNLSAQQLLQKMSQAQAQLNYEFSFVQSGATGVETYHYRHANQNGKSTAQLITLNGVKQEILRRDNLVSYFQANSQPFTIQANHIVDAFPSIWFADIERLKAHYDFIEMGKNRIANRLARTIRIAPKDDFRNQYVVFIDEQSHLLLRSDLLDRNGNLLEQFQIVNLAMVENAADFVAYTQSIQYPPLVEDNQQQKIKDWTLAWLPSGFSLISENIDQDEQGTQQIEHRLYSDGLFSFTVFVADQILPNQAENSWQLATNSLYSGNIGNKEVTIIGQIPSAVAKRIAQEIQFTAK